MGGESTKWMILVATTWVQAFTGTNFDFSSYSSDLKSVLGISQVQLNYLSVASDMGKAFGWCSGLSLIHFPLWVVLFMAATLGLVGYGFQWLLIQQLIALPYLLVFVLCLLAGCSICWFNTVCFVLCIRNFQANRALALSLSISFNGVSAALYTLIATSIDPGNDTLYLFLNALIPLFISALALLPILHQPPFNPPDATTAHHDSLTFLFLNFLAVLAGLYLLFLGPLADSAWLARYLLAGAVFVLALPLSMPGIVYARDWARRSILSKFHFNPSKSFNLVDINDLELHKELLETELPTVLNEDEDKDEEGCCMNPMDKDPVTMLGEEHPARVLLRRWDFWLYYVAYFCGGTIGLVYSNNIGQIAQSLGHYTEINALVNLYSSCSFFGRLLSAAPDFLRDKVYLGRTGWFAAALVPTPIAFFLLAASGSDITLHISTGLIGLSSGFVFAAAVSITAELFGPNSAGVNHNILITNIPIGSLLYGLLAATVYDSNAGDISTYSLVQGEGLSSEATVCMGRKCYQQTFLLWGCISLIGLVSSCLLYMRTKSAYQRFERNRIRQM